MLHNTLRTCLRVRHAIALALVACAAMNAQAQIPYTWTGTTNGLWSTGGNWNTAPTVPPFATSAPFDNVVFNSLSTGTLATTLDLANLTLNQIVVASPVADVSINIGGTSPNTLKLMAGLDLSAATKNFTVTADTGNSIVLGGNNSWAVNSGQTLTVNAPVSGTFGITKSGSGTLLLNAGTNTSSAASTYSGGFTLQAGTVDVRTSSSPAGVSPATSGPFGTGLVTIQGGTLTAGSTGVTQLGNDIKITGNATFIPNFANGIEFKGISTIAAGLTINFGGTNNLTLLDNTVLEGDLATTGSGGFAFRALSGTFNFGATPGNRTITNNSTGTTPSVIRGTLAFPGNTLTLKGTQATSFGSGSGPATGATGGIIVDGLSVTFGAANTFTGGVRVLSGSAIAGASTVGIVTSGPFGTDTLRVSGGNVRTDGTARTVANALILDASASFGAATGSANITFTGDSQTISGNPILTLAGNTTAFTPTTTSISLLSNLTFAGSGSASLGSITETGGPFNLTMNGSGNLSLIGTTANTGPTTISAGTVQIGNAAALPGAASDTIVNNGTLAFSSTTAQVYNGTISGTGALNRLFAAGSTAASTLTLGGTSANTYTGLTTFTGNFANSLILNKSAGVNAIGGDLTIVPTGSGAIPSVMLMANEQIPDTATVTLVGISGVGGSSINFNGFNETIGSLVINNNQGSSVITVPTGTATLTVNGPITLTGTSTNTITISGNLNLGGQTRTITVSTTNQVVTISSVMSNGGIIKAGASPLLLTGTNTFTGPVTVNGSVIGAAVLADGGINSSLGASSNAASNLTLDGGTLRYIGAVPAATDRNYTFGPGGAGFDASGTAAANTLTLNGNPTFSGSGARTLTLTGTNTGANLFPTLITNAGSETVSLVKSGAGFWSVTAANTFTGPVTIAAGTLSVTSLANGGSPSGLGASANAASNLTFNGGILQYVGSTAATTDRNFTFSAGFTLDASGTAAGATVTFTGTATNTVATGTTTISLTGTNTGNNVFGSVIADGATSITSVVKSGAGTWTLSGANTFSGSVSLGSTGSTLNLGNASALGNGTGAFIASGNGTFDNTSGAAFTIANPVQFSAGSPVFIGTNNLTFSNTVTISGANRTITVTNATANLTFNGAIGQDATNRSLTKLGDGAITLNGANTFAGGFTLTLGTVNLGNAAALGAGAITITAGTIDNTSGGALVSTNTANVSINGDFTFTGSNNLSFANGTASNNAGSRTITIGSTGRTLAFGVFTSTANASTTLTANGAGNLLSLAGISLTSPSVTINGARTLTLAGTSDFSVSGSVINGNTAAFNHALTITSTGTVTISAAQTFTGLFTVNTTGTTVVTGDKSGIGGITLTTGTLTLSGNNTHTGATTLTAGTLNIGSDSALGTGAATLNAGTIDAVNGARILTNNNTLTLGGNITFGGTNNLNMGSGTMSSSAGRTLNLNGNAGRVLSIGTFQFTSTTGASTLTVSATGNSSLSLTNFNLSADTVSARTQGLAGNGNVTITGSVVPGNGTLATHALSITNTGTVAINGTQSYNGLLTVNMTATGTLNIGGIKSGTGGLTLTTGTVNVTSASTYTGATAVNGGTLNLGNGGGLGTTAVSMATGTTLSATPGLNGATNSIGSTLSFAAGVAFSMLDNATSNFNVSGATTLAPATGTAPTLSFNLGTSAGVTDVLAITGVATVGAGGAKIFLVPTAAPAAGNYTIISGAATSNLNSAALALNSTKISFNNQAYPVSLSNSTATATVVTVGAATGLDSVYWTGAAGGTWNAAGVGTNWNTSVAGGVDAGAQPSTLTDVYFAATTPVPQNLTNTLGQDYTIGSLNFLATSPAVTINSGYTLTINGIASNGITVASGSAAHAINTTVTLGAAQTWTNNSTNVFTVAGAINSAGFALTITGTGTFIFTGALSGGAVLNVSGGTLNLNAAGNAVGAVNLTASTTNLNASFSPTGILTMNAGSILNVANGNTLTLGNLSHLIGNTNGTATLNVLAGGKLAIGTGTGTTIIGPSAAAGNNTGKIDASLATGTNAVVISVTTLGFASNGGAGTGIGSLILPTSTTATSTITAATSIVIASNSNGGQDSILSFIDFGGGTATIDTPSMTVGGSKSSGSIISTAATGSLTLKNGAAGKMGLAIGNNAGAATGSVPSSTVNLTTTGTVTGTLGAVTMTALQSSSAAGKSTASFILNGASSSLVTLDSITTGTQSGTTASTSGGSISTITVTGGTLKFNSGGTGILYGTTGASVLADGRTSTINVNGANGVLDLNGKPIYATTPTNTAFSTSVNLSNGTLQNVSTLGVASASFAFSFTGGTWLNSAVASQSLPNAVVQTASNANSVLQVNSGMTTTIGGTYSITGNASPARTATATVNGTLSAGTNTISVNSGGVLSGGGSVTSPVTFASGSTFQPGSSATAPNLTLNPGAAGTVALANGMTVALTIFNAGSAGTNGTSTNPAFPGQSTNSGFQQTSGSLTGLTNSSAITFQVDGSGTTFMPSTSYSYQIGSVTGQDFTFLNLTSAGGATFNPVGINADSNSFSLTGSGSAIYLNFTTSAVPEPATVGLLAVMGMGIGGWIRRRSK